MFMINFIMVFFKGFTITRVFITITVGNIIKLPIYIRFEWSVPLTVTRSRIFPSWDHADVTFMCFLRSWRRAWLVLF